MAGGGNGSGSVAATASRPRRRLLREPVPVAGSPSGLPAARRWGRVAAGAVLALLGGWVAASLVASAGERGEVVVTARDLDRFDRVEADDLRLARVAADPGVETIPGEALEGLVGRAVSTSLPEGVPLSPGLLVPEGERLMTAGEAVVGAELPPGAVPRGDLVEPGSPVRVVLRPPQGGGDGRPRAVDGWLAEIGERDDRTGTREASVVVPQDTADEVAAAAADQRIAVVGLRAGVAR